MITILIAFAIGVLSGVGLMACYKRSEVRPPELITRQISTCDSCLRSNQLVVREYLPS